mmetsp:Transcript_89530/g.267048  ORF Transcript_89530/g.267048 Transcript_89530/m.267048 type:complete len:220 (-) Transcript_89530:355-1014(-)
MKGTVATGVRRLDLGETPSGIEGNGSSRGMAWRSSRGWIRSGKGSSPHRIPSNCPCPNCVPSQMTVPVTSEQVEGTWRSSPPQSLNPVQRKGPLLCTNVCRAVNPLKSDGVAILRVHRNSQGAVPTVPHPPALLLPPHAHMHWHHHAHFARHDQRELLHVDHGQDSLRIKKLILQLREDQKVSLLLPRKFDETPQHIRVAMHIPVDATTVLSGYCNLTQ